MKMKKFLKCLIAAGTLFVISHTDTKNASAAAPFGAEEWTQYRLSPDNNAVIDSGHEPLEYMILETEDEVRATPVVADGKVFIGNHNSGDVMAFDLDSGERMWRNTAPNWIHSEAIYHEGLVYVGYGNRFFQKNRAYSFFKNFGLQDLFRHRAIRGTGESGVMALDADTGKLVWRHGTKGEVMPTPAIYKNHLYITTGDRTLYKLTLDEGALIHKEDIGSTVSMSSPNIHGDMLYVGGSGPLPYTFSAYDLKKDEMAWQTEFPDVVMGLDDVPPAVSNGLVITTGLVSNKDGELEHEIYALDTSTGEIAWQDNWGAGQFVKNNKSGAPIIHEGTVFVASPITKTYYAYDLNSGEQLWAHEDAAAKAPPVAKDGIVYFSNVEGEIVGLDVTRGIPVRRMALEGVLAPAGPVIANDTLFIGSQDGNIYVVPLDDFEDIGN
ncbi:PQQ-binding-like beta-propeller repeat protein [Salinicoccus siamensis]|uniref:PQQ-binding-like beta-propeller repeat protein n=2 Tax=Salinicoccus siamensis TaxID=381830 RepID=A0ABV5Z5Y4_9STAP